MPFFCTSRSIFLNDAFAFCFDFSVHTLKKEKTHQEQYVAPLLLSALTQGLNMFQKEKNKGKKEWREGERDGGRDGRREGQMEAGRKEERRKKGRCSQSTPGLGG